MTLWTALVAVMALICLTELLKAKHRAKHGITTDMMGNEKQIVSDDGALRREVEELRERVKVLERIATEDPSAKRLSAEIDALRGAAKLEEGSNQ